MTTPYPQSFFVAHKLFTGRHFGADGVWGDILDGPQTHIPLVLDIIVDAYDEMPTRDTLRVWLIHPADSRITNATTPFIDRISKVWHALE